VLGDANFDLRFHDGPEAVYSKRPRTDFFENMLYGDFHSSYEKRKFKNLTQQQLGAGHGVGFWLFVGQGAANRTEVELLDPFTNPERTSLLCVVKRSEQHAVATAWRLPDQHGAAYYYHKLMLNTPWQKWSPADFLTADNPRGSLEQQCRITLQHHPS